MFMDEMEIQKNIISVLRALEFALDNDYIVMIVYSDFSGFFATRADTSYSYDFPQYERLLDFYGPDVYGPDVYEQACDWFFEDEPPPTPEVVLAY